MQFAYTVEFLPNGLYTIICRASKLRGLYSPDGRHVSGDLRLDPTEALALFTL